MDQDTSKSKYDNAHYYKGTNIKILTEEGLSSGAIENEDGNKLLFKLPDTYATYRINYNDIENSTDGTLQLAFIDPTTNVTIVVNTTSTSSIENLYSQLKTLLQNIIDVDIKLYINNSYIYIVMISSNPFTVYGTNGLSNITNTPYISSQTNLQIIGWGFLNEYIILFTTNETSSTPSSLGQLWKLEYDITTDTIINANSGTLTVKDHLIYNNYLNFSTYWHIGNEVVTNYENSKVGKIYWTDEYNSIRSANILDPNLIALSPGSLDIISEVTMSTPVITKVDSSGSLPASSMVQFAYRLFNSSGNYTIFSPATNPLPLSDFNPSDTTNTDTYWKSDGSLPNTSSDKAVTYTINGIDTSFDIIEHYVIIDIQGIYTIYKFEEENVPSDGNLEIICSSIANATTITAEVFNALTRSFDKAKTITVKDKRLIAGNVSTNDNVLSGFDTRCYRFNNSRAALLNDHELNSLTISGTNPVYNTIPDDFDCINPYNADTNDTASLQYKYQSDGVTMGGEGENISYKFKIQDIPLKRTVSGAEKNTDGTYSGYYDIDMVSKNSEAPIYSNVQLNGIDRGLKDEFQDMKSPTMNMTFRGYARGEIYRFGIVFYDKSSNPFPVKWIGDIKFPEAYDIHSGSKNYGKDYGVIKEFIATATPSGSSSYFLDANYPIYGQQIGLEFTIDVSKIQDKISGFEIVRVKREPNDRTRWGTGIFNNFNYHYDRLSASASTGGSFSTESDGSRAVIGSFASSDKSNSNINVDVDGTQQSVFSLNDRPGYYYTSAANTATFICPTTFMRNESKYSFKTNDYLKTNGGYYYYNESGSQELGVNVANTAGSVVEANTLYSFARTSSPENRTIIKEQLLNPGDYLSPSNGWSGPTTHNVKFINASAASQDTGGGSRESGVAGIGGIKQAIELENTNGSTYGWTKSETGGVLSAGQQLLYRECSYCRIISKQYGGDTFEDRSKSAYISTGELFPVKETSNLIITKDVFGGDVYLKQFAYNYCYMNWDQDSRYAATNTKLHVGFSFPCEVPINVPYMTVYRYGNDTVRRFLSGVPSADPGSEPGSAISYGITEHYTHENTIKQIYYPKDFINNFVSEHPNRLWASEKKIDGELLDSWNVWLPNNYSEVDGEYGQINKVTTLQNRLYFFQDRAFGVASVNDRSTIQDTSGTSLVLGNGGILDYFRYISRNAGTTQKFSVVPTGTSIHFFDVLLKKWMRIAGDGTRSLSDIKGMHSFFAKFNDDILNNDRILQGVGIQGVFDKYKNKVYMTFLSAIIGSDTMTGISNNATSKQGAVTNHYTLSYNENLQVIESFYDYKPYLSLSGLGRFITLSPTFNEGWLHYKGNKNSYYGYIYPTTIELILNPLQNITCIFDTLEYKGEISISDVDQSNLTFDTIQALNDHQDSGTITLSPNSNVIRKFRSWRTNIPRDIKSSNNPRMRDYFLKLILVHTPNSNERMVLHDVELKYRPSIH